MERAVAPSVRRTKLRRHYAKLCDLADFDEEVRARIRQIVPGLTAEGELHRKHWEYAMLTFFLEDVGLGDATKILSVGAGHEEVLFWLANRAGTVVATDIYGEGEFGAREAEATMLTDPDSFAPYPYRKDRLDVIRMDARGLEFRDGEFDAVFTLSSIEHFGSSTDIARAAEEIGRVLRPGGHAFVVTECFVSMSIIDSRAIQLPARILSLGRVGGKASLRRRTIDVLTAAEIERWILRPSGLALVQQLRRDVSAESWRNVITLRDGEVDEKASHPYPHILVRASTKVGALELRTGTWGSIALPLEKPA